MSGRKGRGGRNRKPEDPMVKQSKALSWILRHGAVKEGIPITSDGWVLLSDLFGMRKFQNLTMETLRFIVDGNDKKRFELQEDGEESRIRAVQGHSIAQVEEEGLMREITDPTEFPFIVHGTNEKAWAAIQTSGLNKMNRNHVHFAIGMPQEGEVISGARVSCTVFIEVNMPLAMTDGMKFFVSENKVVLCSGQDGIIAPTYFKNVWVKNSLVLSNS